MNQNQQNQNNSFGGLANNPLFQQAQSMAYGKSPEQLKQLCAQVAKQKGLNIEEMLKNFNSQFGTNLKW